MLDGDFAAVFLMRDGYGFVPLTAQLSLSPAQHPAETVARVRLLCASVRLSLQCSGHEIESLQAECEIFRPHPGRMPITEIDWRCA